MRILWVTGSPPRIGGGGDTIRQAHLLRAVAERHPTDLLVAGRYDDPLTSPFVKDVTEVAVSSTVTPGRWQRRLRDVRHLVAGRLPMEAVVTAPIRDAIGRALVPRAHDYDVVLVEHSWMAPVLPVSRSGRWVVTFHYVPSAFLEHAASVADNTRLRLFKSVDARRARDLERWAVDAYDLTIVCSGEDAQLLGIDTVVPNGVDLDEFRPTPLPDEPELVFVGTLGFQPNVEGIAWFCREVLPAITEQVPHVRLTIVGRDPVAEVAALAGDNVEVVASPPSVLPYLQRARVALVPIRIGSGTRLKALEAMAAGRPVVGTAIGLAGIDLIDGEHALVRDAAADTAVAVTQLLRDDELAERVAARGRRLVEDHYGWTAIGHRLADRLDAIAATS